MNRFVRHQEHAFLRGASSRGRIQCKYRILSRLYDDSLFMLICVAHFQKCLHEEALYSFLIAHFPPYLLSQIYLRKVVEALNGPAGPEVFRQVAGLMEEIVVEWKNYDITLEKRLEVICCCMLLLDCVYLYLIQVVYGRIFYRYLTLNFVNIIFFDGLFGFHFYFFRRKSRKLTACCRRTCAACVLVCITCCLCPRLL